MLELLARAVSATPIPDLTEPEAARAWLDAKRFCAVAIAAQASAIGRADYTVGLARILHRYLLDAHLSELLAINGHAYLDAERSGDLAGQAHALRRLGSAYSRSSADAGWPRERQLPAGQPQAGD